MGEGSGSPTVLPRTLAFCKDTLGAWGQGK